MPVSIPNIKSFFIFQHAVSNDILCRQIRNFEECGFAKRIHFEINAPENWGEKHVDGIRNPTFEYVIRLEPLDPRQALEYRSNWQITVEHFQPCGLTCLTTLAGSSQESSQGAKTGKLQNNAYNPLRKSTLSNKLALLCGRSHPQIQSRIKSQI